MTYNWFTKLQNIKLPPATILTCSESVESSTNNTPEPQQSLIKNTFFPKKKQPRHLLFPTFLRTHPSTLQFTDFSFCLHKATPRNIQFITGSNKVKFFSAFPVPFRGHAVMCGLEIA